MSEEYSFNMCQQLWKTYKEEHNEEKYKKKYKKINVFYDYCKLQRILNNKSVKRKYVEKREKDYDVEYWISMPYEKRLFELEMELLNSHNHLKSIRLNEVICKCYEDRYNWYKYYHRLEFPNRNFNTIHANFIIIRQFTLTYISLENLLYKKLGKDILRIIKKFTPIKELAITHFNKNNNQNQNQNYAK